MTNRKIRYWVIPPQADGECVAHMEEVLETYEMPHNPAIPVLGMDERRKWLDSGKAVMRRART